MRQPEIMGVYRLYNVETGESFVGFSRHLAGARKRLLFELQLNACSYKPLQALYNQHGSLSFEVLEEYWPTPGETELETDAHLTALMIRQKARLNARLVQVQA